MQIPTIQKASIFFAILSNIVLYRKIKEREKKKKKTVADMISVSAI